ncbi:hypothetical protein [Limnoglobus roseus]|uniref:Uncharacterized protein n=1 Tax=Limnoglobus roseus TaxID=2598579 RepID=A0A5C1A4J6_9BACT|nr:hypothetical protein [Limnoglobus roseus]QEL13580.1 hypothetical protein PX52LOC_00438 [Limnoglobus roseus]
MADARQRTTFGNVFRFTIRGLGLTGLLAAAVGGVLLATELPAVGWPTDGETFDKVKVAGTALWNNYYAAFHSNFGGNAKVASWVLGVGVIAVALWLLVELVSALTLVTGRRTAVGANGYLQTGLAVALVVLVNVWSFSHYRRYDCTKDHQFTLPQDVRDELKQVTRPTDVIVLKMRKPDAANAANSSIDDSLVSAADRKVTEKVRDLVDLFREIGPQFKVTVLDTTDEGYLDQLDSATKASPTLRTAIETAPENSIFFHADGKVQRLSFAEFYLLDKTASQEQVERPGGTTQAKNKNLVLIPQGIRPFADHIFKLGEKKPKVGLLIIHPFFASQSSGDEEADRYTSGGLRRMLERNGFDVVDVFTRRGLGRGAGTPAGDTFAESELAALENSYTALSSRQPRFELQLMMFQKTKDTVDREPLDQITKKLEFLRFNKSFDTEQDRKEASEFLAANVKSLQDRIKSNQEELDKVRPKYLEALKNERATEARRTTDVKLKLGRAVADCDVLIVPRQTTPNLVTGDFLPPAIYSLTEDQADVVKDFVKAGKPVLGLFGAVNPSDARPIPGFGPDALEAVFTRLGFEFSNLTVMYDAETRAMVEQSGETLRAGGTVTVPPLLFDVPKGEKAANPIAEAMRVSGRTAAGQAELRRNWFRPIYLSPSVAAKQKFVATIAESSKESWGEEKPVPDGEYVPEFTPAKPDDPKRGTHNEERKGPFPIGAAIERTVPVEWLNPVPGAAHDAALVGDAVGGWAAFLPMSLADPSDYLSALPKDKRPDLPTVRIAVYGHGGLIAGKNLDPAHEKLIVHTLNWQLKRDDRLPKDLPAEEKWQYPRVNLDERQSLYWRLGTAIGLPLVCAYFGVLMLMLRKVR